MRNQRVVIFGTGTAGVGVADQIRDAMIRDGLSREEAQRICGAWTKTACSPPKCRANLASISSVCTCDGRKQKLEAR